MVIENQARLHGDAAIGALASCLIFHESRPLQREEHDVFVAAPSLFIAFGS